VVAEALASHADLVIAAGGDGTVRAVADGLAGSGVPLGLVPEGTANLLACNLGRPLDEEEAIDVALTGHAHPIDLIKLTVDGRAEPFAVMAGIEVDAAIMAEINEDLKAKIGSAAYLIVAGRALGRLLVPMTVVVDGGAPIHRNAMLIAIGNIGELTGGLTLIPGAKPDDGRLDYYIASPRTLRHWVQLGLRFLTRQPKRDDQVDRGTARTITVTLQDGDNYQLDGDVVGQCHELLAEVVPGALTVNRLAAQSVSAAESPVHAVGPAPLPSDQILRSRRWRTRWALNQGTFDRAR
jgi:diacylglycerol kinase family enzyme